MNIIKINTWGQLDNFKAFRCYINNCKVCVYTLHHIDTCKWERAFFNQFRISFIGDMLRNNINGFNAGHQIHSPANSRDRIWIARRPVRKIAILSNLHCTQHTNINVISTYHRKTIRMMEIGSTGDRSH